MGDPWAKKKGERGRHREGGCQSASEVILRRCAGVVLKRQAGILSETLPDLELSIQSAVLVLKLVVRLAELRNGLLRKKLLQSPFLDVLSLVLFELRDEGDGPLENGPLVLLAVRDDLGKLIDALVDGFSTAALDCT